MTTIALALLALASLTPSLFILAAIIAEVRKATQ